ncbi:MAG TPA: hypothetical protein VHF47_14740 [Acidimicrobiales bacterium]|nr:hypothetical protein [Acidimicrobiales bacterium]
MAAILDDLRAAYGPTPVVPDARLQALFDAHPVAAVPPSPHVPRSRRMLSDLLTSLPGKIAAGFVGATLAWGGLGVAGAVPGPLGLASSEDEVEAPATEDVDTTDEADDTESTETEGTEETESTGEAEEAKDTEDVEGTDEVEDDGELPEAPTSASEAAHIHDFDEACGNHGKYVSHFARTGEEPECATEARDEAAGEDGEDEGTDTTKTDTTETVDAADAETTPDDDAKGHGKAKKGGKAAGKGGKGKGRR